MEDGAPVPAASTTGETTCHMVRNDGFSASHSDQLGAAFTNPRPTGRGAARATSEVTELASVALTSRRTGQAKTKNHPLAVYPGNVAQNVINGLLNVGVYFLKLLANRLM